VHQRNPACWFRGTGPHGLCRPGYKYLALTFGTLLSSQGADAHPSRPFDRSGGNPRNATRSGSRCQNRPSRPVRPDFIGSVHSRADRCKRSAYCEACDVLGLARGRPAAGLSSCSLSDSPRASITLPTDASGCKSAGHHLSRPVWAGHGGPAEASPDRPERPPRVTPATGAADPVFPGESGARREAVSPARRRCAADRGQTGGFAAQHPQPAGPRPTNAVVQPIADRPVDSLHNPQPAGPRPAEVWARPTSCAACPARRTPQRQPTDALRAGLLERFSRPTRRPRWPSFRAGSPSGDHAADRQVSVCARGPRCARC